MLLNLHLPLLLNVVPCDEEADTGNHQSNNKNEKEHREGARSRVLVLACVAVEHVTAVAFALFANSTVSAMRVAFLLLESTILLHNHITALHNWSKRSVHRELQYNVFLVRFLRDHILWQLDSDRFISRSSTTLEELALRTHRCYCLVDFTSVTAQFNAAVTVSDASLYAPLDIVLGALACQEVGLGVLVFATVLPFHRVFGLGDTDPFTGTWLQQLDNLK